VCGDCNIKLQKAEERFQAKRAFDEWQRRLVKIRAGSFAVSSKMISPLDAPDGQGRLF
jgi:hypothetical protein